MKSKLNKERKDNCKKLKQYKMWGCRGQWATEWVKGVDMIKPRVAWIRFVI